MNMARTLAQIDIELEEVSTAITAILTTAQTTTSTNGRSLTFARLGELRELKKDLIEERDIIERRNRKRTAGSVMVGDV